MYLSCLLFRVLNCKGWITYSMFFLSYFISFNIRYLMRCKPTLQWNHNSEIMFKKFCIQLGGSFFSLLGCPQTHTRRQRQTHTRGQAIKRHYAPGLFEVRHWITAVPCVYCFVALAPCWLAIPLSTSKYTNNCCLICHQNRFSCSWCPDDESYWLWWCLTFYLQHHHKVESFGYGLAWHLGQTLIAPKWWVLKILVIHWLHL